MGSEPLFQAAAYYTSFIKQKPLKGLKIRSPFPCFVLYLIGECYCILPESITCRRHSWLRRPCIHRSHQHPSAWATYTSRPSSPDLKLCTMTARYCGALRKALDKLKISYAYNLELAVPNSTIGSNPRLPCYAHTMTLRILSNTVLHISPNWCSARWSPLEKRCASIRDQIFKGSTHVVCFHGSRPTLRGFETLHSWQLWIGSMMCSCRWTLGLEDSPTITLLHNAGYVHGDLRDANLMVRKDGEHSWR